MADTNDDNAIHVETDDARGAATTGVMRYVLAISIILVIVAFVAIWFIAQA